MKSSKEHYKVPRIFKWYIRVHEILYLKVKKVTMLIQLFKCQLQHKLRSHIRKIHNKIIIELVIFLNKSYSSILQF